MDDAWKYWVPEARLVVGSSAPERRARYVLNWLRAREPWYFVLNHCTMHGGIVGPLKAAHWREYLNTSSLTAVHLANAKNKQRAESKRHVAAVFQEVFGNAILDTDIPVEWFGRSLDNLSEAAWKRVLQEIAWELSEVGFRYELTELDRYLVPSLEFSEIEEHQRLDLISRVFPSDQGLIFKRLPLRVQGLACESVQERAVYLEALRQVVSRWPSVPTKIKHAVPMTHHMAPAFFKLREKDLLLYYCQTFFEVSGRPPALPRRFPAELASAPGADHEPRQRAKEVIEIEATPEPREREVIEIEATPEPGESVRSVVIEID